MRLLMCVSACLIVSGCTKAPPDPASEPAATVAVVTQPLAADPVRTTPTPPAATRAPEKKNPAKCLGPDIPLVDGATTSGEYYSLAHFNDVTVRLRSEFVPTKLVVEMRPERTEQSFPKVQVSISPKGDPQQRKLGEIVLKQETVEVFELDGMTTGEHYVRFHYRATEPESTSRPKFMVKSVELKE